MAIQALDYWYDGQVRRFLEQIVRAVSGFQWRTGWRNGAPGELRQVPVISGQRDRHVANIMRNNSENTLLGVPLISVSLTGITGSRDRVGPQTHVDTVQVHERKFDPVTGQYTGESGNRYTVERLYPRPFEMTVQIDIWTSNEDQKHQLMEQILTVLYPDIELQNSDNGLDWTAKTRMDVEEINYSSRSIPIGTESDIDIMTITCKIPFWLNPPAKVKYQRIIEQVVTNVFEGETGDEVIAGHILARDIVTPGNHCVRVDRGSIYLLGSKGGEHDSNGDVYRWDDLFSQYGDLRPTISTLRLKRGGDIESELDIIGTIQIDPSQPNKLIWQIDWDTLPANWTTVNGVVSNPMATAPGYGLPAPTTGTRYLLLDDVSHSSAWGGLSASANDIVAYDGSAWTVIFDASTMPSERYIVNLHSGSQLRWTGEEWVLAIDGNYGPGYWRLSL